MPNEKKINIKRRIQETGYLRELDIAPHLNCPSLTVENNPWESFVFKFCGGMGVILDLRITSDRISHIQDFGDLELLGTECNVDWWVNEESTFYKFYRGPEYPREVVLNHCVGKHGIVKPGEPLTGLLLGRSARQIPSEYSHGFRLPLIFSMQDNFDLWHPVQLNVQVDESMCSKSQCKARGSLYGPCLGKMPELLDGGEDLVFAASQYKNAQPSRQGKLHG